MENAALTLTPDDDFVRGYIDALFFTDCDDWFAADDWFTAERRAAEKAGEMFGSIPKDAGVADLHPDTLADTLADCTAFCASNASAIARACEADTYDMYQAGMDYWLTRIGDGAGFRDRGLGLVGDLLTDAANASGEVDVFFGDHVTYGNAPFVHIHDYRRRT